MLVAKYSLLFGNILGRYTAEDELVYGNVKLLPYASHNLFAPKWACAMQVL